WLTGSRRPSPSSRTPRGACAKRISTRTGPPSWSSAAPVWPPRPPRRSSAGCASSRPPASTTSCAWAAH
ncbi:MAG: hypothetical protein AVDCRST_MAG65-2208, partial [uncultured Solirubrobacteraceae bacterium]